MEYVCRDKSFRLKNVLLLLAENPGNMLITTVVKLSCFYQY